MGDLWEEVLSILGTDDLNVGNGKEGIGEEP